MKIGIIVLLLIAALINLIGTGKCFGDAGDMDQLKGLLALMGMEAPGSGRVMFTGVLNLIAGLAGILAIANLFIKKFPQKLVLYAVVGANLLITLIGPKIAIDGGNWKLHGIIGLICGGIALALAMKSEKNA